MPDCPPPSYRRVTRASSHESNPHSTFTTSKHGRDYYRATAHPGSCPSNHCGGKVVSCLLTHFGNQHSSTLFSREALIAAGLYVCPDCGTPLRHERSLVSHRHRCGKKTLHPETADVLPRQRNAKECSSRIHKRSSLPHVPSTSSPAFGLGQRSIPHTPQGPARDLNIAASSGSPLRPLLSTPCPQSEAPQLIAEAVVAVPLDTSPTLETGRFESLFVASASSPAPPSPDGRTISPRCFTRSSFCPAKYYTTGFALLGHRLSQHR